MNELTKVFTLLQNSKPKKSSGSDYTATVTHVEGKTAYVQITGADISDTPVALSIDAKPGDLVRVRVNNGKAWITGNDTAPPTNNTDQINTITKTGTGNAERIKNLTESNQRLLKRIKALEEATTYVGMVIHSTTLDTMEKVIEVYGGTEWIQHSGYFLYGASSGVTANSATSDGGESTHTLTVNEMPSHRHSLINELQPQSYNWGCVQASGSITNSSVGGAGATQYTDYAGGGASHNNMPPYKNVYIWERTA